MIEGERRTNHDQHAAAVSSSESLGRRVVEWFWRGAALDERLRALPKPSDRAVILAQRSRVSAVIARGALTPAEPYEISAGAIACELYRQAAYWALCALSDRSAEAVGASSADRIWDELDERLVSELTDEVAKSESLQVALRAGSFVYFAELEPGEQLELSVGLRRVADGLIARLNQRTQALRVVYVQRGWRLGLLVVLVLGVVQGFLRFREVREEHSDLAVGKAWRASSKFETGGCKSPEQECAGNTGYFFHTAEEQDPWLEIDLKSTQTFSKVEVDNRTDCCFERAVPLVVEVSADRRSWQPIARRETGFSTWRASFPAVHARWVRVRTPRQTFLHLARVKVIP